MKPSRTIFAALASVGVAACATESGKIATSSIKPESVTAEKLERQKLRDWCLGGRHRAYQATKDHLKDIGPAPEEKLADDGRCKAVMGGT